MNPGLLDERITIKTYLSSAQNRYGEPIITYATDTVWANVKKQSGNEVDNSGLLSTSATYIFTVRERDTINEKTIITFEGYDYNVVFVEDLYNGRYLKLVAERRP